MDGRETLDAGSLEKLEHNRYFRQLILPGAGEEGQKKLQKAKVLIVGTGGLGSPVLYYLAAAGVGTLGVLDDDQVDVTNLQRQILHWERDIGKFKVDSALEKLESFNSTLQYKVYKERLDGTVADRVFPDYNLVVAAVDNVETRRIINRTCYRHRIPWIEGAVKEFAGMVMVFQPPEGPCYECLYGGIPRQKKGPVALLGALPGVIGSIQAMEALKILLGLGTPLKGRLLIYDALESQFTEAPVTRDPSCSICASFIS